MLPYHIIQVQLPQTIQQHTIITSLLIIMGCISNIIEFIIIKCTSHAFSKINKMSSIVGATGLALEKEYLL